MFERSVVVSNGTMGIVPRAPAEPGECSMTIIGHDNEGMARLGKVLCEVYCRLHKWGYVQRHCVLHTASRLSMLHKGRFKGYTYLSCNT